MHKPAFLLTWGAGLGAAVLALALALFGVSGWGTLAVIPVGTVTVGYGPFWGVLAAAFALLVGLLTGLAPARLGILCLALALAVVSGAALRALIRRMVRRERRLKRSLALFNQALDEVVKKTDKDEVLASLPELLAEYVDANVSVWVPANPGFRRVAARGLPEITHLAERSVVGRAFRKGKPVHVEDVHQDPDYVDPGVEQKSELSLPIKVRGEVVAILDLGRKTPFYPEEIETLTRFVDAVGHYLALLAEHTESQLVAELTRAIASADTLEEAAQKALALLVQFFGVGGAGLWRWQQGRFYPVAFYGRHLPGEERLHAEGLPPGKGVLWQVYLEQRPRFLVDYAKEPGADPEQVARGVRGIALHPVLGERRARVVLSLRADGPRVWFEDERRLLAVVARVLGLMLRQYELKERMGALLALERDLPELPEDAFYQRLLEAAVRLVPGAEAGSLLVREEGGFRYRAAVGYDLDALAKIRYDEDGLASWCGPGFREGRPRLLSREEGALEARSHATAPAEVIDTAGRLKEMQQNLCVPIVHKGAVLAVLNLDAFADPGAFDEESLEVANAFAVQVAAMLHEAARRRFLERAALTDPLTGLANRRAFDQMLATELARAKRRGYPLALVVMDLTRFKEINDRFGHPAGDRALVRVAEALKRVLRGTDLLFRWGGDEFAAILPYADRAGAVAAARRYAEAIAGVCVENVCLGVNIGVAACPEDATAATDLLRIADDRMYRAKAEGKTLVAA